MTKVEKAAQHIEDLLDARERGALVDWSDITKAKRELIKAELEELDDEDQHPGRPYDDSF